MRVRLLIEILMGLQALLLLVPASLLYAVGALGWFGLFIPAGIATVMERASREGWGVVYRVGLDMLADKFFLGFSGFMIAFGIGLFSAWFLLASGYGGKSLKETPWPIWVALAIGWTAAIPFALSWWHLEQMANMSLARNFVFRALFGLGPMISSILVIAWLYWLGQFSGRKEA